MTEKERKELADFLGEDNTPDKLPFDKDCILMLGDNLELLDQLQDNSIDSIVTDPPYGLKFMNKKWDYSVPSKDFWTKIYRVLKPGGHILSFGGTRTYHRMVVNCEDAGFEVRDCISWLYGSGFPKSLNIGKAVDAKIRTGGSSPTYINKSELLKDTGEVVEKLQPNNGILGDKKLVTKNINAELETDEAKEYEGWGSALKPAQELILLARKPLSEGSIAENVLKWGTGGLNIDESRIGTEGGTKTIVSDIPREDPNNIISGLDSHRKFEYKIEDVDNLGRFPANIILDEEAAELLDEQAPQTGNAYNGLRKKDTTSGTGHTLTGAKKIKGMSAGISDGLSGASRFFYVAKVSKKERNLGLEGFEPVIGRIGTTYAGNQDTSKIGGNPNKPTEPKANHHPTCKPINLLTYLCKLITPKNGVILDPFMGSGSTGIAALLTDFNFIGMEMMPDYMKIAEARISNYEKYKDLLK